MKKLLALALLMFPALGLAQTAINCAPSTPCNASSGPSNTGTGDSAWVAFGKINANFNLIPTQLFAGLALPVNKGGTGVLTITGPIKGNGASAFSAAAAADIYGLFSGTCSSSTFLRGDGSCQTPSGGGNVSNSGTPTQYQITAFVSATTIEGIGPGTAGQALISGGASAYPSYSSSLSDVTSVNGSTVPSSTTLAGLSIAETWAALQTFTNSDLALLGSSTGATTFTSANASATNYTITIPAITDTIATLTATQTFTNKSIAGSEINSGTVGTGFGGTGAASLSAAGIATFSGALTSGHCPQFSGTTGTVVDSGAACGGGGGSGTVNSGTSGQLAYYASTGTAVSGAAPATVLGLLQSLTCNAQTGTTYTSVLGDANNCITMNNASANTATVPTNASVAYAIGTTLTFEQLGAGITTVAPASGVTFTSVQYGSSGTQTYALAGPYDFIQLQLTATNTWLVTEVGPGRPLMSGLTNLASTGFGGVTGNLPLANMASIGADSIVANATGSTATPTAVSIPSTMMAFLQANTTFTITPTGCTPSAHSGGPFGGTITLASGPCTSIVVTMNGATGYAASHGYDCSVGDQTAQNAGTWIPKWGQTASSTTTATLPIPSAAGATDVISFSCSPN